uniref:BTB domain-containing protein n=1 Tax=Globodera pallida TaxID=36090 RepID=A0A183CC62_GLOPA
MGRTFTFWWETKKSFCRHIKRFWRKPPTFLRECSLLTRKMQRPPPPPLGPPVEVTDVEVGAFKSMLAFIYADDLSGLNGENAFSVLYAADKYNIPKLVNSLAFLDKRDFARRCLDYIDRNADALILSEAFLQIDQQLLCEILDRDELWISEEIAIWNAVNL